MAVPSYLAGAFAWTREQRRKLLRWWPQWLESLMIVQAETVLRWRRNGWSAIWRYRSRGRWRGGRPRVSSEVRHLITQMARENFSVGCATDPWRASHARVHSVPSHRIALPARTRQTANTVVADLSSQSSHRLRPPPVSGGAFLHGVLDPAVLFLLEQPDAICGANREVKRGTLSLACSPSTDADGSKNSSASRRAHTRRYALCPTIGQGAWRAHGKRAAIVFRPPFPCEGRRMKLGRHPGRGRARVGCYFSRGSSFDKPQRVITQQCCS